MMSSERPMNEIREEEPAECESVKVCGHSHCCGGGVRAEHRNEALRRATHRHSSLEMNGCLSSPIPAQKDCGE